MRYPNLRYGNPEELRYHAQTLSIPELAKRLRRSEKSVRDWLSGRRKLPWWIPEIIRLQNMEHAERLRQMGMQPIRARFGLVTGEVIQYAPELRKAPATHADTTDVSSKHKIATG